MSCREAVTATIGRIEAVDARTNAVVGRRFDEALAEADAADGALSRGDEIGPLHGVPITVKECLDVTGLPATFGIEHRRDAVATADDPYVARLRAAGAIVVATTNVAQLLAFAETDNPVYGRTANPWNAERSSGGSSGGEGVLTGAGASPLGVGTDIGGSVRIPAAWCGSVGFKPTAGVTPDVGRFSFALDGPIASQVGILAPSTADATLGLSVISNGTIGLSTKPPTEVTVAVSVDDGVFAAAPAVRRAVREAADALSAAGCRIVEWKSPGDEALALLYAALGYRLAPHFTELLLKTTVDRRVKQLISLGRLPRAANAGTAWILDRLGQRSLANAARLFNSPRANDEYAALVARIEGFRRATAARLDQLGASAVLSPTTALAAVRHGATYDLGLMGSYTAIYNSLGWPAGTVPCTTVRSDEETDRQPGRDRVLRTAKASETGSAGLPVGVQLAAPAGSDDLVLGLMSIVASAAVGGHKTSPE
jgi:fatty acid amide hydrolase